MTTLADKCGDLYPTLAAMARIPEERRHCFDRLDAEACQKAADLLRQACELMRTDKQIDERAEFEDWHLRKFDYSPRILTNMGGGYKSHTSRVAWSAWKARSALSNSQGHLGLLRECLEKFRAYDFPQTDRLAERIIDLLEAH